MFEDLEEIHRKPDAFEVYTADTLWNDAYRSKRMLDFHLNKKIDVASRTSDFIDTASSWIIDHFGLGAGKSVCDFGCGPGLYASRFAQSGAQVTGLDFSENSLRYARASAERAGLSMNYVCTDYLKYEPTERFDLVTLIMYDFCALGPAQRKSLLTRISACLKEGGALLLDVYSMTAFKERETTAYLEKNQLDHFWCEDEYYCFVNTFKYDKQAVTLDKYSVFTRGGASETIYNWLQYFSPDTLC
ncbi:MAG: class I SAM-dependent methyltransferase, partial [Pseudomonadota bacterium]